MDDARSQLAAAVDEAMAQGKTPAFLVIDLMGADYVKSLHGGERLGRFRESAMDLFRSNARPGSIVVETSESRLIGLLVGFGRLETFAFVERLRRALPLLAQSFDCDVVPDFDIVEYDPEAGIGGLAAYLAKRVLPAEGAA